MRHAILTALLTAIAVHPAFADEGFQYEKKIAALVQPYLDHHKVNAVSVGVVLRGKVWKQHYGILDGKGTAAPDGQTLYEIGSISKVFTSVLLADAVNAGTLKLDDPIRAVMKELGEKNPDVGDKVTFLHLSHHTSGLPRMPTNIKPADPTNPFAGYDRKLLTEYLLTAKPKRKPGEGYEYSNLGVGLLGDLLSRQAGMEFEELLKKNLLKPLKMDGTTITLNADQKKRFAPPHNSALLPDTAWGFDALAGCGAIRSNVDDMVRFMQACLEPPQGELGKTLELAWKQHKPAKGGHHAMGLGWLIARDGKTRWHSGQTGGYQSMMLVNREQKSGVVLLCNTAGSGADSLAEQIIQALFGMNVKPKSFEKEFQVDPKIAKRLEGKYRLAPGVTITVKVNNNRMAAQITGQQFLSLKPTSETEWKYELVDAKLKFELPKTGKSPKVTLLQNGRELPSPRIEK